MSSIELVDSQNNNIGCIIHKKIMTDASLNILFDTCVTKINWLQTYNNFGTNTVKVPRLVALMGDAGYSYSGVNLKPEPWNNHLLLLRDFLRRKFVGYGDNQLNALLLNYYRNGSDSVGFHSDDEKELGINPTIFSVSLGAERLFMFRNKRTKEVVSVSLCHGDLAIMYGNNQSLWHHSIPKVFMNCGPRINLTYRTIL